MPCNKKTIPEFTKEQLAECKQCKHISGRKIWCGWFGIYVDRPRIITPNRKIIRPNREKGIMGCCGETIRKAGDIAIGYKNLAMGIKYEFTDRRIKGCQTCIWNTWLTKTEYTAFLLKYNIKVIKNFTQLEKLPMLPKYKQDNRRKNLFCRICKCFIPAKASVKRKTCPKNNSAWFT